MLACRDSRVVVLHKTPHLSEHLEIADLERCQVSHIDFRAGVEFSIGVENGLWSLDLGRVPDLFSVDE